MNNDGILDFEDIADTIDAQKQIAFGQIGLAVQSQLARIGRFNAGNPVANRNEVSRAMDFYSASELRLPPNPLAQPRVNTPSLRGVWLQHNLLRHGLAFSVREAILPPGHDALREREKGWAVKSPR